jgi:hypothetical protein
VWSKRLRPLQVHCQSKCNGRSRGLVGHPSGLTPEGPPTSLLTSKVALRLAATALAAAAVCRVARVGLLYVARVERVGPTDCSIAGDRSWLLLCMSMEGSKKTIWT